MNQQIPGINIERKNGPDCPAWAVKKAQIVGKAKRHKINVRENFPPLPRFPQLSKSELITTGSKDGFGRSHFVVVP